MIAMILNSGVGKRMGELTREKPKCMCDIGGGETILSSQLKVLKKAGIEKIVMTTGPFADVLMPYAREHADGMEIEFVQNPKFAETNYIYSMYLARNSFGGGDDVILLHGDLVCEQSVIDDLCRVHGNAVAVETEADLPEKDFKAKMKGLSVVKIGVDVFGDDCAASQPAYRFTADAFSRWMDEIAWFCEDGTVNVYAENALNELLGKTVVLFVLPLCGRLCFEIDNAEDRDRVSRLYLEAQGE